MGASKIFLTRNVFKLWLLLVPAALSSQTPQRPGVLALTSTPPGASITINGTLTKARTNTRLVVAPGAYTVLIAGGSANLHCEKQVQVAIGQTVPVTCP